MSEERALMPLQDTLKLGEVLAQSGFFSDAAQASQCVVKVLAGQELGFGPIASMTGIHIIQGKPALSSNLIAAQIRRFPQYDYEVLESTAERCEIAFFRNGKELGKASFTIKEAQSIQQYNQKSKQWEPLTSRQTWKSYPGDLLFARTISRGARRYCPDVLSGMPAYVPEELGAEVDGETGDVIDVTPTPVETPPPESPPTPPAAKKKSDDDGNGKHAGNRVQELLVGVNAKTAGRYNHAKHILNAIRIEKGDESYVWPDQNDDDAWKEAYDLALAHAQKEAG